VGVWLCRASLAVFDFCWRRPCVCVCVHVCVFVCFCVCANVCVCEGEMVKKGVVMQGVVGHFGPLLGSSVSFSLSLPFSVYMCVCVRVCGCVSTFVCVCV